MLKVNTQDLRHKDCRNYAPLDVAKGICHRTKDIVAADDAACAASDELPKCGNCLHYSPGEKEFIGICGAEPTRPMTYPDLNGALCEHYSRNTAGS